MNWMTFVAEVGFPIVVTLYLLLRIESKLEHLSLTIQELGKKISESHQKNTSSSFGETGPEFPDPVLQNEVNSSVQFDKIEK